VPDLEEADTARTSCVNWVWLSTSIPGDPSAIREQLESLSGIKSAYYAIADEHSAHAARGGPAIPLTTCHKRVSQSSQKKANNSILFNSLNSIFNLNYYICTTRTPLEIPLKPRETYAGTLQLCCFKRLPEIDDAQLATLWLGEHTSIALETQSTEAYRQHWVNACQGPDFDGIVEEYFPLAAATSAEHFFAATNDSVKLKANIEKLTASSTRFLDLTQTSVIHLRDHRLV
jgi:hypothetical protein